jgi:hypothetical protein
LTAIFARIPVAAAALISIGLLDLRHFESKRRIRVRRDPRRSAAGPSPCGTFVT